MRQNKTNLGSQNDLQFGTDRIWVEKIPSSWAVLLTQEAASTWWGSVTKDTGLGVGWGIQISKHIQSAISNHAKPEQRHQFLFQPTKLGQQNPRCQNLGKQHLRSEVSLAQAERGVVPFNLRQVMVVAKWHLVELLAFAKKNTEKAEVRTQ